MPFASRFVACCLCIGLLSSALQSQPAQNAPFDFENDPRIDRREHPNAPRIDQPRSPLDIENPATQPKDNPIFLEFAAWIQKYRLAGADKKPILLAEGVQLAKTRRVALAELIVKNPKRALDWAVSPANRAFLPAEIGAQLETRVAGCAEYSVLITKSPLPSTTPNGSEARLVSTIMRSAQIDGKIYKVYVYGWRTRLTTKWNIPMQGIAVDDLLAIDIHPARVLDRGQSVPDGAKVGNLDKKCPLCGADYKEDTGVVAQIGSVYYFFDSQKHLRQIEEKLIETQLVIGPKAGSSCNEPLDELLEQIKKDELLKAGIGAGNNGVPTGAF